MSSAVVEIPYSVSWWFLAALLYSRGECGVTKPHTMACRKRSRGREIPTRARNNIRHNTRPPVLVVVITPGKRDLMP